MQTTANYGLKKPDGTDVVDIQDFNDNADVIDLALKQAMDAAGAIGSHAATHRPGGSDPIPTAAPSGGLGTANAAGSSTSLARADHTHLAFDSINPVVNGTASAGSAVTAARRDHVHPTDTTRAPLASPALTGTPTAPTPSISDSTTKIATTEFVKSQGYQISTGTVANADKLTTARTFFLTGNVTGSTTFDGSNNVSITATVKDDSHNHVISNVDNLQTTLDGKISGIIGTSAPISPATNLIWIDTN